MLASSISNYGRHACKPYILHNISNQRGNKIPSLCVPLSKIKVTLVKIEYMAKLAIVYSIEPQIITNIVYMDKLGI